MKKYQNFLSENFHFLVVKFSVYLNRRVFVMQTTKTQFSKRIKAVGLETLLFSHGNTG